MQLDWKSVSVDFRRSGNEDQSCGLCWWKLPVPFVGQHWFIGTGCGARNFSFIPHNHITNPSAFPHLAIPCWLWLPLPPTPCIWCQCFCSQPWGSTRNCWMMKEWLLCCELGHAGCTVCARSKDVQSQPLLSGEDCPRNPAGNQLHPLSVLGMPLGRVAGAKGPNELMTRYLAGNRWRQKMRRNRMRH